MAKPNGDEIDCVLSNGRETLNIQVTRAEHDENLWKILSRFLHINHAYGNNDEAANTIRKSIQMKAKKITLRQRADLVLALDALDTPMHAFSGVVNAFYRLHGTWARDLGFKAIWVVGPTATLTKRLDNPQT